MAGAYEQIRRWVGAGAADRICSTHGSFVLHGLPFIVPEPKRKRSWWFW
jgi:hypothetical protein